MVQGYKKLIVIPKQLNRKKLVREVLKQRGSDVKIDFLMFIGDEAQNEPVFEYIDRVKRDEKEGTEVLTKDSHCYTVTIGRKVTQANFFLSS